MSWSKAWTNWSFLTANYKPCRIIDNVGLHLRGGDPWRERGDKHEVWSIFNIEYHVLVP